MTDTGLHRPKIVVCLGSRGGRYEQLVKGEDDIRQDAIMQQVFTSVNDFLRRRVTHEEGLKSTANEQSELKITTYNIIPLSPASAVLE